MGFDGFEPQPKEVSMSKNSIPVRGLYSLKDAAVYLGRPKAAVRELIWSGRLPYIQDGRKMYVDLYDIEQYIQDTKRREKE